MTFIAWAEGQVVRVPSAWTVFTIGEITCNRDAHGAITCLIGDSWRPVESWDTPHDNAYETARRMLTWRDSVSA